MDSGFLVALGPGMTSHSAGDFAREQVNNAA